MEDQGGGVASDNEKLGDGGHTESSPSCETCCEKGAHVHEHHEHDLGAAEAVEGSVEATSTTAPPELTPALIRQLRGKYFTVRHVPLPCGHKLDLLNEPDHRNCEDCWYHWFNQHGELVKTLIKAHKEEGKELIIGMRGKKFFKMFTRFMATVHAMIEEGKANGEVSTGSIGVDGSGIGSGGIGSGEVIAVTTETVDQGREVEGDGGSGQEPQQVVQTETPAESR